MDCCKQCKVLVPVDRLQAEYAEGQAQNHILVGA